MRKITLNYDNILLDSLKMLDGLPSKSGKEGTAYFLNDNYVIKSYKGNIAVVMSMIIEPYVNEINNFIRTSGIRLPQIYTFMIVPGGMGGVPFNYGSRLYLLMERVEGAPLFLEEKDLFADICMQQKYVNPSLINKSLGGIDKDEVKADILYQVLTTLSEYYTQATTKLINLPDGKVEDMFARVITMFINGKHTMPDLNCTNLLLHNQDIKLIDPISLYPSAMPKSRREKEVSMYMLMRCINLFADNAKMFGYYNVAKSYQEQGLVTKGQLEHIKQLFTANREVMLQGLEKVLGACKQSLDGHMLTDEEFQEIKHNLASTLNTNDFSGGDKVVESLMKKASPSALAFQ